MNIQKKIFDTFFKNLEEDGSIPPKIYQELQKMYEEGDSLTQTSISTIIKRYFDNDNQD